MKKILITIAALALALSACAADPEPKKSDTSSQTDTKVSTTTEDTDASKLDRSEFTTGEVTSEHWLEYGSLRAKSVRTGVHEGYERVVVEYTGEGNLGWHTTGWADEAHYPGSGHPIDLGGSRALQINISGVTYPEGVADGSPVTEVKELHTDLAKGTKLTGVLVDLPYEGMHTVTLGANADLKYRITSLTNPNRLVIDLLTD